MAAARPDFREFRSGRHHRAWRYLVPASSLGKVLVLGDVPGMDALSAAREAGQVWTVALDAGAADQIRNRAAAESVGNLKVVVSKTGSPNGTLPFEDGRFDLVIVPGYSRNRIGLDLEATLRESRRVLATGGYFYMTADNRIRMRSAGLTLRGFRRNVERAGFRPNRWWACFPDAMEPKYMMDLYGMGAMDYFISVFLNLDVRTGPVIRRVNRLACRLGVAPYLSPGYAVLGRKGRP